MSTVTFPTTFINRYSRLRCDEQIANEESVGAANEMVQNIVDLTVHLEASECVNLFHGRENPCGGFADVYHRKHYAKTFNGDVADTDRLRIYGAREDFAVDERSATGRQGYLAVLENNSDGWVYTEVVNCKTATLTLNRASGTLTIDDPSLQQADANVTQDPRQSRHWQPRRAIVADNTYDPNQPSEYCPASRTFSPRLPHNWI